MEASGDGKMDYKAWQEYIDWMEQRGLSWIVWSISDKDETCSMLKKSANSEGNWKDEDLKNLDSKPENILGSTIKVKTNKKAVIFDSLF
jgi:endoglucanase